MQGPCQRRFGRIASRPGCPAALTAVPTTPCSLRCAWLSAWAADRVPSGGHPLRGPSLRAGSSVALTRGTTLSGPKSSTVLKRPAPVAFPSDCAACSWSRKTFPNDRSRGKSPAPARSAQLGVSQAASHLRREAFYPFAARSVQFVGSGHAERRPARRHGPFRTLKSPRAGRFRLFGCQDTNSLVPHCTAAEDFFTRGRGVGVRVKASCVWAPLLPDRRPSSLLSPCGQHTLDDGAQDNCSRIGVRGLRVQDPVPSVPLPPGAPYSWPFLAPFAHPIVTVLASMPAPLRPCGQSSTRSRSFPNSHPPAPTAPPSDSDRPLFSWTRAPSVRSRQRSELEYPRQITANRRNSRQARQIVAILDRRNSRQARLTIRHLRSKCSPVC